MQLRRPPHILQEQYQDCVDLKVKDLPKETEIGFRDFEGDKKEVLFIL